MGEVAKINNSNEVECIRPENDLIELTEGMLSDAQATIESKKTLSVPIGELSTLGTGVSSLIPALNTVTQTTTFTTEGLYQLANASVGDTLKVAKSGNFWGAFKTADGASKFVQLKEAGPVATTTSTATAINPAIMIMAVALFSIEKELDNIAEMEKQILSFLEVEQESEIEADVITLMKIINKYKLNWDNERFVASNHKLVLDIQRTTRKNMNAYSKKINDVLKAKQFIVAQNKVNATLSDLEKKFKYYKLSLYTFSLASLMEIMLSGNFNEEYISDIEDEIREMSQNYRELFGLCSVHLEKMGNSAVEINVVKGLSAASKAVGTFIGNIPLVKDGPVDELLQDKGAHLKSKAKGMEKKSVGAFAALGNPGTGILVERMQDIIRIYNHTSKICLDKENIYLIAD